MTGQDDRPSDRQAQRFIDQRREAGYRLLAAWLNPKPSTADEAEAEPDGDGTP